MIERLLPLTKNKLEILKAIYESGEIHMLEISKKLSLHPYSVQKTLLSLKPILEMRPSGRTVNLGIDKNLKEQMELLCIIEDYKIGSSGKKLKPLIANIETFFSKNKKILACCLFGSYARGAATEESDIDLLFVISSGDEEILKSCRDISAVVGKEINPVIMAEKEFILALKNKEPAIETMLVPAQRLILIGKEYFLRKTIT